MQELILHIQDALARAGAPEWLQRPSSWLVVAGVLAIVLIAVRLLFKRSRAAQPAPTTRSVEPLVVLRTCSWTGMRCRSSVTWLTMPTVRPPSR